MRRTRCGWRGPCVTPATPAVWRSSADGFHASCTPRRPARWKAAWRAPELEHQPRVNERELHRSLMLAAQMTTPAASLLRLTWVLDSGPLRADFQEQPPRFHKRKLGHLCEA